MLFLRQTEEQPSGKKPKRRTRKTKNSGQKEGQEHPFCLVKVWHLVRSDDVF